MSMLPAEVTAELQQLLQALQSADNVVRSQAEEHLQNNWTGPRPEVLLMGLAEQVGNPNFPADKTASHDPNAGRSFAAVIFRRIASKTRKNDQGDTLEIFISLGPELALVIRQKLLEALVVESERGVRNKISDAIAEIARQYTEIGQAWPELLQALFQLSMAPDAGKRETAFRVFTSTPGIIEKSHEDAVAQAFSRGFKDDSVTVRIAAMEAFAAFFRGLKKKSQPKFFELLPEVLNILPPIKESQDSDDLSSALISLIDLAGTSPKMFRPVFNTLVKFSISVIQDKEFSDVCRQNALELMATFADYAPSMCKKDPTYTQDMITQCLSLMTDLGEDDDDASEWLSNDDLDQEESDSNHVAGEQCMDRLANKLGGTVILAPTFSWLPRMINSSSWRDRHAALMAISAISEGCRDLMLGELQQVLNLVVPSLKDPHPRVRWAGCNALGQMSTDFAPTMQREYYDIVLKTIIPVLDSPEDRVKSHAAAALVNFCEEAEKTVLEPYLDDLLSHLFALLQSGKRYVQEQALSTIATIADSAEQAFGKYYDTLMPLLVNVLRQESDKDSRMLRAKAMECATLIALAVGRERLGNDAIELVKILTKIQNGLTDGDDPQAQYLMHSWGRMCRVMGKDFIPFLSTVLPPLVALASAKADIQLLDDDEQADQLQQEDGWDLLPLKGKMIGIKTSSMDDKHMAIELLVVYAQVLEAAFAPYAGEIMKQIALPGLAFFFHDPVRFVSARLVPQLLNSYKQNYGTESNEMNMLWSATVDKLLEVLAAEPAIDTLAEMYQCFYESVEVLGRACLTADHMNKFIDSVQSTLEDYRDRVVQRDEEKRNTTTEDAEDEDEDLLIAMEDDQTLLSDMSKAFHVVFKYHGSDFLRPWERLMSAYESFLKAGDPSQRQWGLCIMDDVLEYCGANSIHYANYITQPLLDGCKDPAPAIRQAAAYGIGVAAHRGGAAWSQFLGGCVPVLFEATMVPDARDENNVYATENACAALAKILHFNAGSVQNIDAVITQWVGTLPVVNDEEAAPYAYAYLTELINKRHPAVMAQTDKVFVYIAQGLGADVLRGQTAVRVVEATKVMLAASGLNAAPLLQQFPQELQQTISAFFT
ncbi:importin beta-3 [Niveomyces insectorum RCEF 264]|uniref:Importin beta-3 n=1 Tax=Niveomyces insectorum RCEF 264 TaxID=1081102 RepID=A0A167PTP9_9HYPO|nr:importin beta-3 [Niveomyces insectorum RCEF 264]